jgi:enolase-phosphatase E1
LQRWREAGIDVVIYSSGSELAQRLLFATTSEGDLTRFISKFFDTAVGAKTSPDSYRHIAGDLARPCPHLLFISDVTAELDAARAAGCRVLLSARPGNRPQPAHTFDVIESFDEVP